MPPEHKYTLWHSFINGAIGVIRRMERYIGTIKRYREMVNLCLNMRKNDEWNGVPPFARLYMAGVYYGMDIDGTAMKTSVRLTFRDKPEHITAKEKTTG